MRDFIYIENDRVLYGQATLSEDNELVDNTSEPLSEILMKDIRLMLFDLKRNEVLIKCINRSEYLINVDRGQSLTQLKNDILAAYPGTEVFDENSTLFYLMRKPIFAIFLIFILLIIVGAAGKNGYKSGASMKVNAVTDVVNGMSALDTKNLVIVFAVLLSLPMIRIFWLFRNVKHKVIIKLH